MEDVASASTEGRRILLVDGVELNRALTEAVLRSATYEVDSVNDGPAAIAALETRGYDLVLMDLEMPGLGGYEAALEIRRRALAAPQPRKVTLAAISAKTDSLARLRSKQVGMAAHIGRPIAPLELLRQVRGLMAPANDREPDPWQRHSFDEWVDRLGEDRMSGFLTSLLEQFRELLSLARSEDRSERMRLLAHDVASTGGMLGFMDVTACCRAAAEEQGAEAVAAARLDLAKALTRAISRLDRHFLSTNRIAEAA